MLDKQAVHIWREADGEYHIEWQASHPHTRVTIRPLESDTQTTEHEPGAGRARIAGLPLARRHYFSLQDQHGNEVLAMERRLGMDGAVNFRDFGGYHTAGGRQVKWGYLFRSGQLSHLSKRDIELLDSLQLDLVCDFRREEEQLRDPSLLPHGRAPVIASLPIVPGSNSNAMDHADYDWGGRQAMFDFMVGVNQDFVVAQSPAYRQMFEEVLAREDARFLVHCAAGKDRTGFAAAIILLALGVPRETVMRDYLLTAQFFHPQDELQRIRGKYGMEHMKSEDVLPMLEVHEDYLATALAAIDREYGGVDVYLREALGVAEPEVAELRSRYLEKE
jgi:protein-tyrosine phosphatase